MIGMPRRHTLFHAALLTSTLALSVFSANAQGKGFAVLHDFGGPPGDGSYP